MEQIKDHGAMGSIGIFIINPEGAMLLHKKTDLLPSEYCWEIPYLIHYETALSPLEAARNYLTHLGVFCQLYEAFTVHAHQYAGGLIRGKGGRVIIARASTFAAFFHSATDVYAWMPIDEVVRDTHEHPARYAPWLRSSLEGVVLYLKDIIKNCDTDDCLLSQTETL